MSYKDAAQQILNTAGEAMSADEITENALEGGLITPRGNTPTATMGAVLYRDIQENGDNSPFVLAGPGRFALRRVDDKKQKERTPRRIVYVLTNPAMPDYVKVGSTDNLETRVRQLDQTNTPLPFELFYAAEVADAEMVEKEIAVAFSDKRVRKNREFYAISPEKAAAVVRLAALRAITLQDKLEEDDRKAVQKANERAARFSFKMLDVPPGSILKFADDDSITCEVVDNRNVRYEGRVMLLGKAALRVLHKTERKWPSARGSLHWKYKGETLQERRDRIENE